MGRASASVNAMARGVARRLVRGDRRAKIGMEVCLAGLASRGFFPASVVDVGAAAGGWTRLALSHWPAASYLLIEPLSERIPELEALASEYPNVHYAAAAAAAKAGTRTFNVSSDLDGSSFLYEGVEERPVATVRLDDLVARGTAPPPAFMKLDVQGFELDALDGATRALHTCQAVLLEVRLFRGRPGMPMLRDVIEYMAERDFRPYEIADVLRRPLDGAQAQLDVVFAQEGSALLEVEGWA